MTFLFTDIEGSTQLLEQVGAAAYADLRGEHHRVVRAAVEGHGGVEVDTAGDGFFVAFPTAGGAVAAAAEAQRALAVVAVRVRMGLHSGAPIVSAEGYAGTDVHRGARIVAAAHGGQILLSSAAAELAADELPPGVSLHDLGEHRLRDLSRPQHLFQLVATGLPSDFPPLLTLGNRPTNLPSQPTPLVGREPELAAIVEQLRAGARLVTLTGPGGVGKTRLALQAAVDALDDFRDGSFLVALEPVTDAALVPAAIAQTLGVREHEGVALEDALREFVRDRQLLLVADNFEHVLEAASLLGSLVAASKGLCFLVTSRSRLRLVAEHEFPVLPLSLPRADDVFSRSEAVALFAERARASRPDFELTRENAPTVGEICMRLDGLPLAIELAAARIRLLSPQALLVRLEQRLPILTGGARDLPERQRTLRAAIEWSYRLLAQPEQRFFARLSAFVGGFTFETAEAVCFPDELGLDTFDAIAALVDNSLARQAERATDEPRFALLDTIREFAQRELEASGEADQVRRRHAEHFLGDPHELLKVGHWEDVKARWGPGRELEFDNVRAALEWADAAGSDLELPLATLYQLFPQVFPSEGRRRLKKALDRNVVQIPELRARALAASGSLAWMQGDIGDAESCVTESLRLFREVGARDWEVKTLTSLAGITRDRGDEGAAQTYANELEAIARRLGDDRALASAFMVRARLLIRSGGYDQAREFLRQALVLGIKAGDDGRVLQSKLSLAILALLEGDVRAALAEIEAASPLVGRIGVAGASWFYVDVLAGALGLAGEMAVAVRLFAAVERWHEERGEGDRRTALRDRTHRRVREAAAQPEYREARDEGRRMSADEAIAVGLKLARHLMRRDRSTRTD